MTRRLRRVESYLALALVLVVGGGRREASARPGDPAGAPAEAALPMISVAGSCPGNDALAGALANLLQGRPLRSPRGPARVDVADAGDSYRVAVAVNDAPRERLFRDATRDCARRARFAAVFIVLTLMPPDLPVDAPAKPAAPPRPLATPPTPAAPGAAATASSPAPSPAASSPAPPPVAPSPAPPPAPPPAPAVPEPPPPVTEPVPVPPPASPPAAPSARRLVLELGAALELAPPVLSAPQMLALGGALRASWGGPRLAGVLGVAAMPRADFSVGGLRGRESRLPIDAGIRTRRRWGALELGGDLGLLAEIFRAEGLNTASPKSQTRLDLGARVGVTARFGRGRVAPIAGVNAIFFPKAYQIETTPAGALGKMPSLWLGATVGLALSL